MSQDDYKGRKSREAIPGTRRGRPPGQSAPVTIMTVSLDPSTLALINEWALKANRTRSGFVRGVMLQYIGRKQAETKEAIAEAAAKEEEAKELADIRAELEAADADPTHGGMFNPDWSTTGAWFCTATKDCASLQYDDGEGPSGRRNVGGWIFCPACKTQRPDDSLPPAPKEAKGSETAYEARVGRVIDELAAEAAEAEDEA